MNLLDHLMGTPPSPEPIDDLEGWWSRHLDIAARFPAPAEQALAAGAAMDRLGYAFASGYQAAALSMFGGEPRRPRALCATEGRSAHPRDIRCALSRDAEGWRLNGHKSFVTLGTFAEELLVVVSLGTVDDNNQLRVARITPRAGVTVTPLPAAPFVPEIPHAALTLDGVRVQDDELLAGDGYTAYLKPFRTVEDSHVHAALLGWLLNVTRRHRFHPLTERVLAAAVAIAGIAAADPRSAAVHLALAGAMDTVRELLHDLEPRWRQVGDPMHTQWERDRPLLSVAAGARAKRREAAWRALSPPHP